MSNKMWTSEDEFMKDLDVMGEIWEGMRVHNNAPTRKQEKYVINESKRSVLLDDSDDEEDTSPVDFDDENDPEKISYEIQRQIAEVTGNVNDNKALTEYWRPTRSKQDTNSSDKKIIEEKQKSSLIVQSNIDINKLKLVNKENDVAPYVTSNSKTTNLRKYKKSVADAIQSSIKPKKPETNNIPETIIVQEKLPQRNINVSPIRKKEKIDLPSFASSPRKVLGTYKPPPQKSQPSNRFSLGIRGDGYRDYYTGQKLAEVEEIDDFNIRQNGDWYSDDQSSSSGSFVSDRYGYRSDFSMKSSDSNKILNLKSDLDFPPLA